MLYHRLFLGGGGEAGGIFREVNMILVSNISQNNVFFIYNENR